MSKNKPLVSIIMNCYNGDKFLREAIESVYGQSYSNWEIIFWDNASTDDSSLIANSYDRRIKYFLADKTTTLGEARHLALSKVSGKYIAFLDCDDIYLKDKLDKQVALMQKSNFAMCYGSVIVINNRGMQLKKSKVKYRSGYLLDKLLLRYEISMQSVMIRKSILDSNKLFFDKSLTYSPDYDLFMKIACLFPIGVIDDFISSYRILDNSLSKQSLEVAPIEIKHTLDAISKANPKFMIKFNKEFDLAYKKLHYYNAVFNLYSNERKYARNEIRKIMNSKIEYFILYLIMLLPISNQRILKILGREF